MTKNPKKLTLAHVTHEAVEKVGGIGTVLEGMIASPVYQQRVGRSILVGPTAAHLQHDPKHRLGGNGTVLYSSVDEIDELGLAAKLRPIEWAFDVTFVYGKRTFNPPGEDRVGEAEVLLIDVFRANQNRLNVFKLRLWETFKLDSTRYEGAWDFEEYVRLAEPAHYALRALLSDEELPCVLFAHEFMGMPAALAAMIEGGDAFRTVFHAHECATARRLVEDHPGHDTMFYNVLAKAREQSRYVDDIFGDQGHLLRHALISQAHLCDGVIAVGDYTQQELQFLSPKFAEHPIELVYNGLPAMPVTLEDKLRSRNMLLDYAQTLIGVRPDWLLTHVTRPVISKGLWRDAKLCHELDERLAPLGERAVHFILTSAGGVRRRSDVLHMEQTYGWPRHHRCGYPDLVGPEEDLSTMIDAFNAEHDHVQIVLVNQFGFDARCLGQRLPKEMDIADLRLATDAELGMATYEPFGISPLEPLAAGAVCVISNVCGCEGFVQHITKDEGTPNVLTANYTRINDGRSLEELKTIDHVERNHVETIESARLAEALLDRLPRSDAQRAQLIEQGQQLVARMGWDQVIGESLLPMLDRITTNL